MCFIVNKYCQGGGSSTFDPVTFNSGSSNVSWQVPKGITKIRVDCVGSQGGNNGGKGGRVQCILKVTPNQTLYITVGSIPSSYWEASYNASDIRIGGTSYNNRVVVAGGGGSTSGKGRAGGVGGGTTGGTGANGYGGNSGGKGGTQTAGGEGGAGTPVSVGHYHNGNPGSLGLGGNGSVCGYEGNSGAGGAGYYGGGAGAGDWNKKGAYTAGGGGGSSYTNSTLCTEVVHTQGYRDGNGYIIISMVQVFV